ncbi:MAG: hypothetical protein HY600_00290 [Candidatus Omnitrophica bacterium]|nr:hypothetical protein [Candidatus Omnitrophota bacterium]
MKLNIPFFDVHTRETEAAYGALVEIVLKSRIALQLEANHGFYEEDVNAYLAGVLFDYMNPAYQQGTRPCLATREADVFLRVIRTDDASHAYWVYKVNADDRLIDVGIFHPGQSEAALAQAKAYYGLAASFNHRVHRRPTAVSDILDKLSQWTERYVLILNHARRDYLSFVDTVTNDDLRELQQRATQDEFLDLYSAWQRTADPALKRRLLELLAELRRHDPLFPGPNLNLFHD